MQRCPFFIGKLRLVDEFYRALDPSEADTEALQFLKDGCNFVLAEIEEILGRARANHGKLEGVPGVQGKVSGRQNDLNMFLDCLRR